MTGHEAWTTRCRGHRTEQHPPDRTVTPAADDQQVGVLGFGSPVYIRTSPPRELGEDAEHLAADLQVLPRRDDDGAHHRPGRADVGVRRSPPG